MFPIPRTSKLAQHTLGALRAARSFLLLEDDHEVGWEADEDELTPPPHPHRVPGGGELLRMRRMKRRAGAPAPTYHVCLSPVERRGTLHARVHAPRAHPEGRRQASGGSARAGDGCSAASSTDKTH
jgi:hypothetical protein